MHTFLMFSVVTLIVPIHRFPITRISQL